MLFRSWVSETLEAATKLAPPGLTVVVRIYLTEPISFPESDDVSIKDGKERGIYELQEKIRAPSLFGDSAVQVTRGSRPNLKQILQEEADFTDGRMGVTGSC